MAGSSSTIAFPPIKMSLDPKAKTSAIKIDPHGDVIMELGKERLLVSAKVLSLVSPVFAAMFKPLFKEGKAHMISETPSTITLPEDDAKAFALFCNLVHHRSDKIPRKPDLACLEQLAFICDKYNCAATISHSVILWLQRHLELALPEDLNKLLFVAYILDLPESFSRISWEILVRKTGAFVDLPGLTDHPLVRHDLLVEFNIRKMEVTQSVQKAIMKPTSRIKGSCNASFRTVGKYHSTLRNFGILPYEPPFEGRCFLNIVRLTSAFPDQKAERCQGYDCECKQAVKINLGKELRNEMDSVMTGKMGLCLDCVKRGRRSRVEGGCRIFHL